jgi:hypothetical protein
MNSYHSKLIFKSSELSSTSFCREIGFLDSGEEVFTKKSDFSSLGDLCGVNLPDPGDLHGVFLPS